MTECKLFCLGRPLLEIDGKPGKLEMRKSLALLVYLRMADHDYSRESLSALLWPEYDQQHAQSNLRRALSSLNKSLQGKLIDADREKICLRDRSKIWLDVECFQGFLSGAKKHTHADNQPCAECLRSLENAIQLYRGNFMDGFNLLNCTEFDDWQFIQRERLCQDFTWALQKTAEGYEALADWGQAIAYARRWVAVDRLHEPAQRYLIDLHRKAGQRSAGLKQYDEMVRILHNELGQEPEPETTAVYLKIRDGKAGSTQDKLIDISKENTTAQYSEPVLKTKLYIPASRGQKVSRQSLLLQLNQIEQYPLAILSAPAGFGKTTSLVEWATKSSLNIGWYSLDKGDNDVVRFLTYLCAAFESIQSGIGIETTTLLRSPQPAPAQLVLTHLLHDLEGSQTAIVMVLDDYQSITAQAVHDVISFFLDHLPQNVHLIIATRADPPLGLARLRSRGQLLEIRTNDLRFNPQETFEYLNQIMGLPLTAEDFSLLENKIEGWIAGLQMAALSIQGREDKNTFIKAFSGSNRYILDYLTDEVLSKQTKDIQTFLLQTSILDRLCSSICSSIIEWEQMSKSVDGRNTGEENPEGKRDCQAILEYLERTNLFITPLDNERQWYRYHHLFADLLRARLDQLYPGLASQLHVSAAAWCEQNGLTMEAIQHASIASNNDMVEHLIEQHYIEMMNHGEMSWLHSWTGKLSKELVYRRPWLCLYEAYSRTWFGQLEEANLFLKEAEMHFRSESSTPGDRSMVGYHAYVKSRVTAMQGDTRRAIELCRTARENIPVDNLGLQIDVSITLGYEYFLYGDFVNANKILHEMIQSGYNARAINNPVAGYAVLARLHVYQGRLHDADDLLQKAGQLIHDAPSGQYRGVIGLVEVGIAALLCEWNDLEAALDHMKQGLDFIPWWGKTDDLILAYTTLVRIQLAQGNRIDAAGVIEKAAHLIQASGVFSESRNALEATQIKMWQVQGDWLAVDRWVATLDKRFGSHDPFQFEDELAHITEARVYIAQDRLDEAIHLLTCLDESARSGGRQGRLIEILILKALALHRMGSNSQANLALTQVMEMSEPEGYLRIFLDEGQPMQMLLAQWLAHADASTLRDYTVRLLSQFDVEPHEVTTAQAKAAPAGNLGELLTQREMEVLHLIAMGKTHQEIARQLVVSTGTVKTHTASIYRKLDVTNQTGAVARARQMGILP